MKRRLILIGALGFGGLVLAAPAVAVNPFAKTGSTTTDCGNGRTLEYAGPTLMWPPNHKPQSGIVAANGTDDDANVVLTVAVTNDETVDGEELNGSGNTDPATDGTGGVAMNDAGGDVSQPVSMRSERSGRGDGRVYTIDATAIWNGDPSTSCMAAYTVTVPHDMRPANRG